MPLFKIVDGIKINYDYRLDMDRRDYLRAAGASLLLTSGCSQSSPGGSTPTPTETESTPQTTTATNTPTTTETQTTTEKTTDTETSTETSTPDRQAPEFELANPVTTWIEPGDTESRAVDAFGSGGPIVIAFRFDLPVIDNNIEYSFRGTVYDDGSIIDEYTSDPIQDRVTGEDTDTREAWVSFGREPEWDLKEYTVDILLQDEQTGKSTIREGVSFALNERLTDNEARLINTNIPDEIQVGESFDYSLEFENQTNRDSSIVTTSRWRWESDDSWTPYDGLFYTNVAKDRPIMWANSTSFSRSGTFLWRFDDINETVEFTISE